MTSREPFNDSFLDAFISYLENELRASKHTVLAYRNDLWDLFVFLEEHQGKHPDFNRVSPSTLHQFAGSFPKHNASSLARKISAIRSFFKFLNSRGLLEKNPASGLEAPKQSSKLPSFMTIDDILKLTSNPGSDLTYPKHRDFTILRLFYATGMRIGECEVDDSA